MKKILNYLCWLPFAISFGSLVLYIIYTLKIKLNSSIIVTETLTNTLKTYLIIFLVSLFIGLFIVLIKKIYNLIKLDDNLQVKKEKKVKVKKQKSKKENIITTSNDLNIAKENEINVINNSVINDDIKDERVTLDKVNNTISINENKKEFLYKVEAISCPECGNLVSKDAAICPNCGVLFDETLTAFLNKREKEKEKKKKKSNVKVFIVNILLIILFLFLIFLIANKLINIKNENNQSTSVFSIIKTDNENN